MATFCSQSMHMYAFRVLRSHGLPTAALHSVVSATTIARSARLLYMYASRSWLGLTTEVGRTRLHRFYNRLKRLNYNPDNVLRINRRVAHGDNFSALLWPIQHMCFTIFSLRRSNGQ